MKKNSTDANHKIKRTEYGYLSVNRLRDDSSSSDRTG